VELAHRRLHHVLLRLVEDDVLLQLARSHIGVGQEVGTRKPLPLPLSRYLNAGTSMWMSIRSSSGPLIRFWYRYIGCAAHRHSRTGSPSVGHERG
jgi:hypothetical protein